MSRVAQENTTHTLAGNTAPVYDHARVDINTTNYLDQYIL